MIDQFPKHLYDLFQGRLVLASSYNKDDIHEWSKENNITIHFVGSLIGKYIWYVPNDDERVLFTLRWAE